MYSLGLLTTPLQDFGKLIGLGIVCGFYGMFFAVPLRKFYILRQRLVFPDAAVTAVAIRTLHSSAETARKQICCLLVCFVAAFFWAVCRDYAPGILKEWNFFYWISLFSGPGILIAHNWGWGTIDTTPALFGLGMIIGLNASLSFYLGSILSWGIIGPITVALGETQGKQVGPNQMSFFYSAKMGPRYWLLWPGILIMLCATLAEIALHYKVIGNSVKAGIKDAWNTIRRRETSRQHSTIDPVAAADQVPLWVIDYQYSTDYRLGEAD
jgi:uncharacterized oligopeptide transporter (OPT) family protein